MSSNKDYYTLYLKYKNKYLNLKSQIGGFEPETEFLTNNISQESEFYLNQNLFSYWISSSHNTYLPYGQVFDPSSVCYYRLQSMMYHGGCIEIDTDAITKDNNDVIITHLPTNQKSITLSSILKIVCDAIEDKKKKNIVSGPLILTFDNKKLKTKEKHMVFWNVIEKELLNKYPDLVYKIDENFNPSAIPISQLSNKILMRWGQNTKCDSVSPNGKVGKELCPPPKSILDKISSVSSSWMHLLKGHGKFGKEIIEDRNQTVSVSVPLVSTDVNISSLDYESRPNQVLISNTQRNLMRIYPHWSSVKSGNYDIMKFYRNGVQIVAINLQTIEEPWFLNSAIFLPSTGVPCTPTEILASNAGERCDNGWEKSINNSKPLAYRLKPLWLLGLIPHPGYYNLDIELVKVEKIINGELQDAKKEYTNIEFKYGLTNSKNSVNKLNKAFRLDNIDVSIPFFVVDVWKSSLGIKSEYKSGVEIPWSISKLSDTIQIDLHKIRKTMVGSYNKVELFDNNADNDCINSHLFNTRKQIRLTIKYTWSKSKEVKTLIKYNETIRQLRNSDNYKGKGTSEFLNNLTLFNEYQDRLAQLIATNGEVVEDTLGLLKVTEGQEDETYEVEMKKYETNDEVTNQENITDE